MAGNLSALTNIPSITEIRFFGYDIEKWAGSIYLHLYLCIRREKNIRKWGDFMKSSCFATLTTHWRRSNLSASDSKINSFSLVSQLIQSA